VRPSSPGRTPGLWNFFRPHLLAVPLCAACDERTGKGNLLIKLLLLLLAWNALKATGLLSADAATVVWLVLSAVSFVVAIVWGWRKLRRPSSAS
jgi:hypothetical protein